MHSLIYDEGKKRVTGVRVIDANTRKTTEYFARVVFLCASTLNSTAHPAQHAFSRVSRMGWAMTAASSATTSWIITMAVAPRPATRACSDRYYRGRRSTSMYIPRFRNVGKREEKFTRGYGYEVYTARGNWTRGIDSADFGADFKNEITRPGEWSLYMEGYGETLPYHDNRMWLSHDKLDPWGMPQHPTSR